MFIALRSNRFKIKQENHLIMIKGVFTVYLNIKQDWLTWSKSKEHMEIVPLGTSYSRFVNSCFYQWQKDGTETVYDQK